MEIGVDKIQIEKYRVYKQTELEWLGEIPKDWKVFRLKNCCDMIVSNVDKHSKANEIPVRLCNYVDVYKNDFITKSLMFMHATASYDEIQRYRILIDDVLITKDSEDWRDIGVPSLVKYSEDRLLCGYHLAILRPKRFVLGSFLMRALLSQYLRYQFSIKANGITRYGISHGAIKDAIIALPPLEEQTAIAEFLDRKTSLIDKAINIKEQQIELLKERRQILIHKAVTRGLNPDVKMKDSGVEWIGEIPEHWEISFLSYVAKIDTGSTPDRSRPNYWNGNIPWVKTGEVNYSVIYQTEEYITEFGLKNSATRLAPKGTVLMAMYGQGVTRGRVAILGTPATYNQACCAIQFNDRIFNIYGYYFFIAAYANVRDAGNETSQMNLSSGYISKLKIPIPSKNEQVAISTFIETASQQIDTAILLKEKEIEKLKEYKSTLINSAVTGKIKVC